MNEENIYLDQEAYEGYLESISNLEVNLNNVIDKINKYRESKENLNDYEYLLTLKEGIENRLNEKKKNLSKIVIVEKTEDKELINIGDIIDIKTIYSKTDIEFSTIELVAGESDLDSEIEKISVNTPLGKKLYNAKVGSEISYLCYNDKINVQILNKHEKKVLKKTK